MIKIKVSLTGDYQALDEGLVDLQKKGVQIESLEGLEGWLLHSFYLSGVENDQWKAYQNELLAHCLSDPQTINLFEQWFWHMKNKIQTFSLPEGVL